VQGLGSPVVVPRVARGALWQRRVAGVARTRLIGRGSMEPMSVDIPPGGTRGAKAPPRGAVGRMLMGVARRMHRLTGSKMSGRPLLYLTTVGAKSGQPRTAVVMPFPEADDAWLIVASANGAARHPAWLHNLAAHPDRVEIEFEGRKTAVTPQTLTDEDRATAWKRITSERPNFAAYEQKTDRAIPVVRLSARPAR
jgi:deazaflavin-dependent oxidoreductase (nitroreductase family)